MDTATACFWQASVVQDSLAASLEAAEDIDGRSITEHYHPSDNDAFKVSLPKPRY